MTSPRCRLGSFMARWLAASASSFSEGGGIAVRAFATNSSDRRRASSTRCCHCSRVSAESGKSSDCWLKQYAEDATIDQVTMRAVVQMDMTWTFKSSGHLMARSAHLWPTRKGSNRNRGSARKDLSGAEFLQRVGKSRLLVPVELFDPRLKQRAG